jgi:hypothetical protein
VVSGKLTTEPAPAADLHLACTGADALLVTAKGKLHFAANWSRTSGREFADPAEGVRMLRELCRATGGTCGEGDEVFAPSHARVPVNVEPSLWLVVAVILLIVELLLRRLPALTGLLRHRR